MAPDLGLTSLAPFPKPQTHPAPAPAPAPAMWNNNNNNNEDDDDDSWEVRAFEEDTTGNLLGCTWPPRSYTCTFCRREFRSAQALGGHMNVHRRDRARLHEPPPPPPPPSSSILVANGLCLLYPLPNPNSIAFPNINPSPPIDYSSHSAAIKPTDTATNSVVSSVCTEPSSNDDRERDSAGEEELDLELRLGRRPPPPP